MIYIQLIILKIGIQKLYIFCLSFNNNENIFKVIQDIFLIINIFKKCNFKDIFLHKKIYLKFQFLKYVCVCVCV